MPKPTTDVTTTSIDVGKVLIGENGEGKVENTRLQFGVDAGRETFLTYKFTATSPTRF